MLRVCSAVLAFTVFGAGVALAGPYKDPEGRFDVTVPTGWQSKQPNAPQVALVIASDDKAKGGVCLVMVRDMPQTRKTPQADLDAAFGELLTKEFWVAAFESAGMTGVVVETTGSRAGKGRKIFHVVATLNTTDATGQPVAGTSRQELHPVPGALHFVNCTTSKQTYAAVEPTFQQIFASYQPHANQLVVSAPEAKPSVLTLYEGARFDGTARVVAQNTADVQALGVTASVAVAGFGQWEICEGANYSGKCLVVAGSTAADEGQVMRIGSVRRYMVPGDVLGAAGAIGSAGAATIKAAAEHLAKPR